MRLLDLKPGTKVVHKDATRLVVGEVVERSPRHGSGPWVMVRWGSRFSEPIPTRAGDLRFYRDSPKEGE